MSYREVKKVEIGELRSTLQELVHEKSGARIMHIANDDEENLFNLSFQTRPSSSNGVAHILEHTVLCGSTHFPVKDPFFGMTRRSLSTFMNALTGADFTCYPAASCLPKDFYNLLEVYLDAVFYPRLLEESFLQEGHRLEFAKKGDPRSKLEYKGVVFNEMKGALATGDARLEEEIMQALFPDVTYGVNSGGDPKEIVKLTYQELKEFHATFYHPSRCLYFFYGNLPLERHLAFLEEKILGKTKALPPLPPLPLQKRFTKPVYVEKSYPLSEDPKDKTLVGMSWLTCSILDQVDLLALHVINILLMGTDAGPLKRALLESKLCQQADNSLDSEMNEIPYCIVCRGCQEDAAHKLQEITRATLQECAEKGFDQALVTGALHQLEVARTEILGGSTPYGLILYFRAALLAQHGGHPEDGLRVHTLFGSLRKKLQEPRYLSSLIKKYFLENPHFVLVVLHPDPKLGEKELQEEKKRLTLLKERLSESDKKLILAQTERLSLLQKKENLDLLPKVTPRDIKKQGQEFLLHQEKGDSYTLFHHDCFTNGFLYVDLLFDLPKVAAKDLIYLRLFVLFLPELGCGGRNYAENLDYILKHIAAIGLSLDLYPQVEDPSLLKPAISLRGKALVSKAKEFFLLMRDMIQGADFRDLSRVTELLTQHFYDVENSIQSNPLRYAINLAASGFSLPSQIAHLWYGLGYYDKLKEILAEFQKNPETLLSKLENIQKQVLGLRGGDLVISSDQTSLSLLKKEKFYGLFESKTHSAPAWSCELPFSPISSQGRMISSPVAFTALLFPTVPYLHKDSPALSMSAEIMENAFLHKKIREQGGAYGCGAFQSMTAGQFYFYSYRDPHLVTTKEAFSHAASQMALGKFTKEQIEEAQLGLFQELDTPLPPGSRAITAYARLRSGRTPELRQQMREHLLSLTKKQIIESAQKHLVTGVEKGVFVSFASKEFLERENSLFKEGALPLYST